MDVPSWIKIKWHTVLMLCSNERIVIGSDGLVQTTSSANTYAWPILLFCRNEAVIFLGLPYQAIIIVGQSFCKMYFNGLKRFHPFWVLTVSIVLVAFGMALTGSKFPVFRLKWLRGLRGWRRPFHFWFLLVLLGQCEWSVWEYSSPGGRWSGLIFLYGIS